MNCLECKEELGACLTIAGPEGATQPGDLAICGGCGAVMVCQANLSLKTVPHAFLFEAVLAIMDVSRAILVGNDER